MKVEVKVLVWGSMYTGLTEEGCSEGLFTSIEHCSMYIGQIKDNKAHGKGVLTCGSEHSGDWAEGRFTGYGESTYADSSIARGQWRGGYQHGSGIEINKKGTTHGQWVMGYKHGPMMHISPDGSVNETIWIQGQDSGAPCNADDVANKAEEGTS